MSTGIIVPARILKSDGHGLLPSLLRDWTSDLFDILPQIESELGDGSHGLEDV